MSRRTRKWGKTVFFIRYAGSSKAKRISSRQARRYLAAADVPHREHAIWFVIEMGSIFIGDRFSLWGKTLYEGHRPRRPRDAGCVMHLGCLKRKKPGVVLEGCKTEECEGRYGGMVSVRVNRIIPAYDFLTPLQV